MTWSTAYPAARRSDHVDVYQSQARGEVHVDDPYDWMEEHSSETEAWIHAQSALTNEFLAQNGDNARFKEDLRSSYNYPKLSFPKRYGTGAARRWYWFYNSGLQPKSVLYRSSTSACPDFSRGQPSDAETFFDQNLLSKDHTVALRKRVFSKCGRYFAYGVSKSGSDLQTIYVRPWDAPFCKALDGSVPSVAHGQDEIRGIKSTSLTWTHDSKGFFYSGYGAAAEKNNDDKLKSGRDVFEKQFYHRLGTPQSEDVVVMKDDEHEEYTWGSQISALDGRYLFLWVFRDTELKWKIYLCDLQENVNGPDMKWIVVCPEFEHSFRYLANDGNRFYARISKDAPNQRIVRFDLTDNGISAFTDVVPEDPDALIESSSAVNNDYMLLTYTRNVQSEVWLYSLRNGQRLERIAPDFIGLATVTTRRDWDIFGVTLTNFTTPSAHYRYDFAAPEGQRWALVHMTKVSGLEPDDFIVEQKWFPSKDGTKVPMFIVRHRKTPLDGSAPAFQYGYGGFAISSDIYFSHSWLAFVKRYRAVVASVNIRGGNEFGERWHEQGMRENKTNVFDDFIAATDWLVANKYAAPGKVIINGGSNGGLLVTACANRAPEGTYGAVVAEVGVLDMLKFHKFTIGKAWAAEFGNPDEPEAFDNIYAYSPLHNIPANRTLPPILLMTADHDDRVVPMHSFKMAATLQHLASKNPNPLLVRIDIKSGHGMGRSTDKYLDDVAAKYGFAAQVLNLKYYEDEE